MAFENITKGEFKSDFTYSKGKKCKSIDLSTKFKKLKKDYFKIHIVVIHYYC